MDWKCLWSDCAMLEVRSKMVKNELGLLCMRCYSIALANRIKKLEGRIKKLEKKKMLSNKKDTPLDAVGISEECDNKGKISFYNQSYEIIGFEGFK